MLDTKQSQEELSPPPSPPNFWEVGRYVTSFFGVTIWRSLIKGLDHWSFIDGQNLPEGLILGALPINHSIVGHGKHHNKIIRQCQERGRPLGHVLSCLKPFEQEGVGLKSFWITPVSNEKWGKKGVTNTLLKMQDFGANADLGKMEEALKEVHSALIDGKSVLCHCKAGVGRSFTVLLAYILLWRIGKLSFEDQQRCIEEGLPQGMLEELEQEVRASRPQAWPTEDKRQLILNFVSAKGADFLAWMMPKAEEEIQINNHRELRFSSDESSSRSTSASPSPQNSPHNKNHRRRTLSAKT